MSSGARQAGASASLGTGGCPVLEIIRCALHP
jgi:hypothetical protein